MSITVNIIYHGRGGSARAYVEKMLSSGIVATIRAKDGNEAYDYYYPVDDPESVLLIDRWRDQEALDAHHASAAMAKIMELRDRYNLHVDIRRFTDLDDPE